MRARASNAIVNFAAVLIVSIAFLLGTTNVYAENVTINLGYSSAKGSGYTVLAEKFAELAEKYSNGTIKVEVRCCSQMTTEDQAFKGMQLGTVDMYIVTGSNVSPHFPLIDAFVLPYIFQNKRHAYTVLDGPVGKNFAKKLQDATKVHLLTYGFVGYRDFYNSRGPIKTIADMKGLKVRVPMNAVMIDTYVAFGAAPIPLAWADTLAALQNGTVHGGDNGVSFIKSQKFYELMKNLAVLDHFAYITPLFASSHIMQKLDGAQNAAVQKAAAEAGDYHREKMTAEVGKIREFLTTKGGMKLTNPDKSGFIKAARKVQDRFVAEKSPEFRSLIDAIRTEAK